VTADDRIPVVGSNRDDGFPVVDSPTTGSRSGGSNRDDGFPVG
jgi:hypothetical protein